MGRGELAILVVDDEEMVRSMVCAALKAAGWQAHEAADADGATAILADRRGDFDILLTDICMPEKGGRELAREVREEYPHVRVIYMTGFPDQDLEPGARVLSKPFTSATLRTAIHESMAEG